MPRLLANANASVSIVGAQDRSRSMDGPMWCLDEQQFTARASEIEEHMAHLQALAEI